MKTANVYIHLIFTGFLCEWTMGWSLLPQQFTIAYQRSWLGRTLSGPTTTKSDVEETPAEDRLFFPPYIFPFWGLPYGMYSNGGFFNPGLFPFVPGGPGFPPYDGIFGGPFGPGRFPGGGPTPFKPPPMMGNDGKGASVDRKKSKTKKKKKNKTTTTTVATSATPADSRAPHIKPKCKKKCVKNPSITNQHQVAVGTPGVYEQPQTITSRQPCVSLSSNQNPFNSGYRCRKKITPPGAHTTQVLFAGYRQNQMYHTSSSNDIRYPIINFDSEQGITTMPPFGNSYRQAGGTRSHFFQNHTSNYAQLPAPAYSESSPKSRTSVPYSSNSLINLVGPQTHLPHSNHPSKYPLATDLSFKVDVQSPYRIYYTESPHPDYSSSNSREYLNYDSNVPSGHQENRNIIIPSYQHDFSPSSNIASAPKENMQEHFRSNAVNAQLEQPIFNSPNFKEKYASAEIQSSQQEYPSLNVQSSTLKYFGSNPTQNYPIYNSPSPREEYSSYISPSPQQEYPSYNSSSPQQKYYNVASTKKDSSISDIESSQEEYLGFNITPTQREYSSYNSPFPKQEIYSSSHYNPPTQQEFSIYNSSPKFPHIVPSVSFPSFFNEGSSHNLSAVSSKRTSSTLHKYISEITRQQNSAEIPHSFGDLNSHHISSSQTAYNLPQLGYFGQNLEIPLQRNEKILSPYSPVVVSKTSDETNSPSNLSGYSSVAQAHSHAATKNFNLPFSAAPAPQSSLYTRSMKKSGSNVPNYSVDHRMIIQGGHQMHNITILSNPQPQPTGNNIKEFQLEVNQ